MPQELVVRIIGDASSLERALKKSSRATGRFGRDMDKTFRGTLAGSGAFQGLGRSVAFASSAFLGGFGLTVAIRSAFQEMSEMQKVSAQTATVIKSTGGVAGVTAKHVDELALSLMNLSGVDDEAIKSSENLLLTFTNVRNVIGKNNDIFDQATKTALDLSVRFDRDLSSSAITLGKALQDPVRGLLALRRTGVQFDDAQQKTIKRLVATGHLLEAQKVILAEVRRQTEGAAAAYGQTLAGKLNIAKESLLNMAGSIATALTPALQDAADQLARWLKNPKNQKRVVDDLTQAFRILGGVAQFVGHVVQGWVTIGQAAVSIFRKAIELASHLPHSAGEWARALKEEQRLSEFRRTGPAGPRGAIGKQPARRFGAAPGAAQAVAAAAAAAAAAREARQARRRRIRQANEAARQEVLDRAEFAVERTTATKTLRDDLAALRYYNSLLTKRIKGGHGTLELEREQFRVQQQIADVLKKQADLAKRTKKRLGVDVTRFQKSARGQFVLAGGGGGRGVVISGGVHLHGIRSAEQLERELLRRRKQRARSRRANR